MSRVISSDMDGYITSVVLPSCVPANEVTLFKINAYEMLYDDDYWFERNLIGGDFVLCFPDGLLGDCDVVTAIDESGGSRKTLWSWSSNKGDIILNGKLFVKNSISAPKPVEDDRCKSCGTMGEVSRMACICPKCGMVVWGC
jgi:hypothetical protein